ncbi:MAG: type II toxin-antitoxin system Phd/YefM family antitoxin, partial [Pseudomonadota bacterium]
MKISTSVARDHLSAIIMRVQDPRAYCVLTRHGKPVAAIVSMAELKRIWSDQDIDDIRNGRRPMYFRWGRGNHSTNAEAADAILKVQLDRRMEREVLTRAGKEPLPGGEVAIEMGVERPPKRWWWPFR